MATSTTSISGPSSASSLISSESLEVAETQVSSATASQSNESDLSSFQSTDSETGSGLQSFSALFASSANIIPTPEPEITPEQLGNNLVVFSSLSEARAQLGPNVTTCYFEKITVGNDTYLRPLKKINPKNVDFTDISKSKPTYLPVGEPIAYTPTALTDIDKFSSLNSIDQKALVQLLGVYSASTNTYSMAFYENETDKAQNKNPILTSVVSSDGSTIYIVEKLDKTKFANMPYADQLAISGTASFDKIKITLGLSATKEEIDAILDARLAEINKIFNDRLATSYTASIPGGPAPVKLNDQVGFFTKEHLALFTDQITVLREQMSENLAIYNRAEIENKLSSLMERFERAFVFGDIPIAIKSNPPLVLDSDPAAAVVLVGTPGTGANGTNSGMTAYVNVMSLDKNATIKAGFDKFIKQEETRLAAEKESAALIYKMRNPDPNDPQSMDAPQLLFQLQMYRNIIAEAELACVSEMVRQQNDLISSYSKVQSAITETLEATGDSIYLNITDPRKKTTPPGISGTTTAYTEETTLVISMFQNHAGEANRFAPKHPLETLRNIGRPYIDAFSTTGSANKKTKVQWSQYSSQLKDTVNILGQELQSNSSKANAIEKDKTRNSQLASEVNTRMYEVIQQLSRMGFW